MTKRKVKEDLKKPDFMLVTIGRVTTWIKENFRLFVVGVSALVIIALAFTGYKVYLNREDEKLQYQLAEGVGAFQEYSANGNGQALQKAESIFKQLSESHHKGLDGVAKLYLAKIYYTQGKNDNARSLYQDVKNRASAGVVRNLAETALQHVGQTAK